MAADGGERLVPLDRSNWQAALEVCVTDEQLPMVADHQPIALVVLAKAYVQPGPGRWEPLGYVLADGSCVAVFALSHVGTVAEIRNFAVDHRHQRSGVGTRVMTAAIDWCRQAGCSAIELTMHPRNHVAGRLYEKAGLRPTGEMRNDQPLLRLALDPDRP